MSTTGTKRKRDDSSSNTAGSKKAKGTKSFNRTGDFATKDFVKKYLAKNQELKFFAVENGVTAVDFSGTIYDLSGIAQGDTDVTRDGDEIMPKSLNIRGSMVIADSTNVMRFIVFRWLQSTTPVVTDILGVGVGSLFGPYAPYNVDSRQKFNVLYDKIQELGSTSQQVALINKFLPLAQKSVQYSAGTTTGTNKIWALAISDSGAASHPGIAFTHELRFTDS